MAGGYIRLYPPVFLFQTGGRKNGEEIAGK